MEHTSGCRELTSGSSSEQAPTPPAPLHSPSTPPTGSTAQAAPDRLPPPPPYPQATFLNSQQTSHAFAKRRMGKSSTIDAFFKKTSSKDLESNASLSHPIIDTPTSFTRPAKSQRVETPEVELNSLERDPGKRPKILDYDVNQRDEIRRSYIKNGPYQPILSHYPKFGSETHLRSFQASWFKIFPSWLEYSPSKDAAFCLPCYLFSQCKFSSTFTVDGFRNWKKVRDGQNCAFLNHVGKDPNSFHKMADKSCKDLMEQTQHVERVFDKFTSKEISKNRLRLRTSVDSVLWLAIHGCAFRGHNETEDSINRGNFLGMISILSSYNEKVNEVVLKNAPQNASYTSPQIQKEILHVISTKVKNAIREEIGDAKFSILVDEARDESKKEQMSIVLRFVNKDGILRERFFGLVHVPDTAALTLQNAIYSVLSHHNLDIQNIRGQGYDGASNMRGEWNGLQALISNDCPYACYVHCLAHRLQLALVAASREVIIIHKFFVKLSSIANIVGASCKRNDALKVAQAAQIEHLLAIGELETGRGLNQISTLQRPGDTRWSSHLRSISSLINMFSPTCEVLINIIDDGTSWAQRGDADTAYEELTSFEFVFILHLMKDIMQITDLLCQALQSKSQDILNAMHLVSSTKTLLQKLRDDGWSTLLTKVKGFCEARNIDILDMNARYVPRGGRARHKKSEYTIEHHYRVDIFYAAIDSQLQELNERFNDHTVQLLMLSSALDPRNGFDSFRADDIWLLVDKFYPLDFKDEEKLQLKMELSHYECDVVQHEQFKKMASIYDLCQWLVKTRRSTVYQLIFRVIVLVLTLPVSTATTERSFSAMSIVKSRLRNKMEDEFLTDSLIVYIEKEIATQLSVDSIIDDFRDLKERRVPF